MWILIGQEKATDGRTMNRWKCGACGYESCSRFKRSQDHIKCKKCLTIERNRATFGKHRGVGDLTSTFFTYFKGVARRRGISFSVTIEELWDLFVKQGGKCALSGLPITLSRCVYRGNYEACTSSIDRINSHKGYELDNVQWVHKYVNVMKNGFAQDEFIHLCHKVATQHADPEPSSLKGYLLKDGEKVQRLTGEESLSNKPDTSARHPLKKDDDIVRHSKETRRMLLSEAA